MADIPTPEDIVKINDLLRRGLDPELEDAQSDGAWQQARAMMLNFGMGVETLQGSGPGATEPEDRQKKQTTPDERAARAREPGDVIMPFGKFRGLALSEIYRDEYDYFRWLVEEATISSPNLAEASSAIWAGEI